MTTGLMKMVEAVPPPTKREAKKSTRIPDARRFALAVRSSYAGLPFDVGFLTGGLSLPLFSPVFEFIARSRGGSMGSNLNFFILISSFHYNARNQQSVSVT